MWPCSTVAVTRILVFTALVGEGGGVGGGSAVAWTFFIHFIIGLSDGKKYLTFCVPYLILTHAIEYIYLWYCIKMPHVKTKRK